MAEQLTNPALIIIDVQKGFDDPSLGERNNVHAEENIAELLNLWRAKQLPVFHIQHISTNPNSVFYPGTDLVDIKELVQPIDGESVIQKRVNSAFIGTDLEKRLREQHITDVVIVGLTTPHCVSTTTRMSGNLGFNTYLVADATAAFALTGPENKQYSAEEVHQISLATLHNEFASIVSMDQLKGLLESR
ncbi:cysteine hydrolase family protein [Radiobacillus sp. PE A8.2]|uniref:cysteine hydrolase family protein n=1 Tax=Radiobacillus sp. PE A8.2 TaxID=3380349 RepID=UPI00388DDB17